MPDDGDDCYHGLPATTCPLCAAANQACWVTKGGNAYHSRRDCRALASGQQRASKRDQNLSAISRTTVGNAKGRYQACMVCVQGVCLPCARGFHARCDPAADDLDQCACSDPAHQPSGRATR
jgi:hypothetical protein